MEFVVVTAMIVGAVELVRRVFMRDWFAVVTILVAVAVGAVCGVYEVEGVDVATGIILGLAGSGLVTVATKTRSRE